MSFICQFHQRGICASLLWTTSFKSRSLRTWLRGLNLKNWWKTLVSLVTLNCNSKAGPQKPFKMVIVCSNRFFTFTVVVVFMFMTKGKSRVPESKNEWMVLLKSFRNCFKLRTVTVHKVYLLITAGASHKSFNSACFTNLLKFQNWGWKKNWAEWYCQWKF